MIYLFLKIILMSMHLISGYEGSEKMIQVPNFTDNRYGHVMEMIDETNPIQYNKQYYYKLIIDEVIQSEGWMPEEDKIEKVDNNEYNKQFYTFTGKVRAYYDKDAKRVARRVSVIEPYIKVIKNEEGEMVNADGLNEIITSVICGKGISKVKPKCKIISIRLYDEKCIDSAGNPTLGTWGQRQEEIKYEPDYLNRKDPITKQIIPNIIVDYKN